MEQINSPERTKFSLWIQAIRPFAYSGSVIPVLLSASIAFAYHGTITIWWLLPIAIVCGMLFQTGGNLISEHDDFMKQVDRKETLGGSRILVDGLLKPSEVLWGGRLALIIGFSLGLIFVYLRGLPVFYMGLAGALGAYWYTAGPVRFKYLALGDTLIFILFGPLMVVGAFYTLTGLYYQNLILVSLPLAFLIVAVVHANNTRDILHDGQARILTLAGLLGIKGAKSEYYFLVWGAFVSVAIMAVFKVVPVWTLLVFLSLPPALKNLKAISTAEVNNPKLIAMLDVQTAQHHLLFGLLYCIGFIISRWF